MPGGSEIASDDFLWKIAPKADTIRHDYVVCAPFLRRRISMKNFGEFFGRKLGASRIIETPTFSSSV